MSNNFPKLHNAMWPGLVGKGNGGEPPIDLDTMLRLTAGADVNGQKFDGVDLFLALPHTDIGSSPDDIKALADKIGGMGFAVGSLVAPVWGGSTLGGPEKVEVYLDMVKKACDIAKVLNETGVRKYGVIRIDSSTSPEVWAEDPVGNQKKVAEVFRQACDIAADYGERLAAEGEICWGGMHNWKDMVDLLEMTDRPNIGFQADMAHTLLYLMGYNAPEHRIVPGDFNWDDDAAFQAGMRKMTAALRPWTIDFHVAQNDGTVFGSGSHDKTGRHCQAYDPNGKLDIARDAGYWLRDENGELTKAFQHICWDGCMFPNAVMMNQQTWNDILSAMIKVRDRHGWSE
ncbi:MAG: TIM barrel protein [Caldilineales bacterium]|nr:TIM barrel protein [Caldilineales bacterium]